MSNTMNLLSLILQIISDIAILLRYTYSSCYLVLNIASSNYHICWNLLKVLMKIYNYNLWIV